MGIILNIKNRFSEKQNPIQPEIARENGEKSGSTQRNRLSVEAAITKISTVQRAVTLLTESAATLRFDVKGRPNSVEPIIKGVRAATLDRLLNYAPNPYQDPFQFKVQLVFDLLMDGNIFIYFDGQYLHRIPPRRLTIVPDQREWIAGYRDSGGDVTFDFDEMVFIRDGGPDQYRGQSRLTSIREEISTRFNQVKYLGDFFENGVAPGSVFYTDAVLGKKMKDRYEQDLVNKLSPSKGGSRRPVVLDGGFKYQAVSTERFTEISQSTAAIDANILAALGIPPVILSPTNNVQARPAQELFYHNAVIPIFLRIMHAFERYFGYDLDVDISKVAALAPDMQAQSQNLSTLVNNGIITPNEARQALRKETITNQDMDTIRIPANIAGSAAGGDNPGAGRPSNEED